MKRSEPKPFVSLALALVVAAVWILPATNALAIASSEAFAGVGITIVSVDVELVPLTLVGDVSTVAQNDLGDMDTQEFSGDIPPDQYAFATLFGVEGGADAEAGTEVFDIVGPELELGVREFTTASGIGYEALASAEVFAVLDVVNAGIVTIEFSPFAWQLLIGDEPGDSAYAYSELLFGFESSGGASGGDLEIIETEIVGLDLKSVYSSLPPIVSYDITVEANETISVWASVANRSRVPTPDPGSTMVLLLSGMAGLGLVRSLKRGS